jgi:hypothetical protein
VNLRARIEQLEERERKLLFAFFAVFATMVVFGIPVALSLVLGGDRDHNRALSEAIAAVNDNRNVIEKRAAERKRVEGRYARKAPPLAGFLAQMAEQVGVEIPETQDRSMVPHGKKFEERSTQIRLRNVGMLKLANFMEKIEQSGYAVNISKLNVRSRGKPDQYDVEMIVSAFDAKAAPPKKTEAKEKPDADGEEGAAKEEEEEP